MISSMIDTQDYLIINRKIISQDVADFDYTPTKENPEQFHEFKAAGTVLLLEHVERNWLLKSRTRLLFMASLRTSTIG
jgi:hypothetical protein